MTLVLSLYVVISGVIFHFLEYNNEGANKDRIANVTLTFLAQNPCIDINALRAFADEVIIARDAGALVPANQSEASNWDIPSAIFFSTTVVTTIGYGHISPNTAAGQMYCMFLALTGIPICLALLSGIGIKVNILKSKIDASMTKTCDGNRKTAAFLRPVITTTLALAVFVFLPALVFVFLEDWNYGVSLYYVIISLSTVGFGDYVAGVNHPRGWGRAVYRILLCVYLILGLAWLASAISSIQERFADTTSHVEDIKVKRKLSRGSSGKVKGNNTFLAMIKAYDVVNDAEPAPKNDHSL